MSYKVQGEGLLIADGRWVSKDNPSWLEAVAQGATVEGETVTEPSYVELRAAAYPPMSEQADMQYHDQIDGTTTWKDAIQAVKDQYPKTITGGESIAEVPAWVTEKADAWLFNDQLTKYRAAVERLSQYVLADGREEMWEDVDTGATTLDPDTEEVIPVMAHVIVQTAIEPLPATVEVTTYDDEGVATTETVPNPEIVRDQQERQEAQAIVDATPQVVVEAANA